MGIFKKERKKNRYLIGVLLRAGDGCAWMFEKFIMWEGVPKIPMFCFDDLIRRLTLI